MHFTRGHQKLQYLDGKLWLDCDIFIVLTVQQRDTDVCHMTTVRLTQYVTTTVHAYVNQVIWILVKNVCQVGHKKCFSRMHLLACVVSFAVLSPNKHVCTVDDDCAIWPGAHCNQGTCTCPKGTMAIQINSGLFCSGPGLFQKNCNITKYYSCFRL